MKTTPYQRGRAFEYRVQKHFRKLGYLVHRAYASKGPFDLIVLGHCVVMLVQCKTDGVLLPAGWNKLWDACALCSAVPVMVMRDKRKIACYQLLDRKNGARRQPRVLFAAEKNRRDYEWVPKKSPGAFESARA